MATMQSWRKAYGAIKDTTTVSLAKVNSEYKELDVAIVKATNHVECPPKERHVRKIFLMTSASRPRADVAYCIHALARRLAKTHNWTMDIQISNGENAVNRRETDRGGVLDFLTRAHESPR